jgi:hypothetical protein
MKKKTVNCFECGKPISDRTSIERGMGPTCWNRFAGTPVTQTRKKVALLPRSHWTKKSLQLSKKSYGRRYLFTYNLAVEAIVAVSSPRFGGYCVRHIVNHAPGGMDFGYRGSGPSDCARSILVDCVGLPLADLLFLSFEEDFIAIASDGFILTEEDIREWVAAKLETEPKGATQ